VYGADHVVECIQYLVRVINATVGENVRLDSLENPESCRSRVDLVYLILLALAVSAAILAWRLYKRFSAGRETSADHFEGSGIGRMRFLAFCGILLGVGFSGAILLNAFSLIVVPPCAI